jgi:molybdopterin molybdotransferase
MRNKISLEDAIEKCCMVQKSCNEIETIPVEHGVDRVVASDLKALCDLPPFNSSQMDGYAICKSDLDILNGLGDSEHLPLQVMAHISAGNPIKFRVSPGQTVRIMTGAVVPEDTAAVIKQEQITRTSEDFISICGGNYRHSNITSQGSFIKKGLQLVNTGELLDCYQIERIASAGIAEFPVYAQPAVYIVNTGSELILPGRPLTEGKIYSSNRALLNAKLQKQHCKILTSQSPIQDNLEDTYKEISHGLEAADMVIVSGGAADGDYDLVPIALKMIKADFIYNGLEMQPGAKSSAVVKEGKLIFSLPGNPSANDILFEVLILPVLNKLKGIKDCRNKWFDIILSENTKKSPKIRRMYRGEILGKDGSLIARPLAKDQPNKGLAPLILDFRPGQGHEGDIIRAMLI